MHNKEDNKLVQLSQNRSAGVGLINQDYGNYLDTIVSIGQQDSINKDHFKSFFTRSIKRSGTQRP